MVRYLFADGNQGLPESASELVDLIGKTVIEQIGDRGYAMFMLGGLGASILEHHANPLLRAALCDFFQKAHGGSLETSAQEEIWKVGRSGNVDEVFRLTQNLAVSGSVGV